MTTETILESRLNAAKHRNPASTLSALSIATGFLQNRIVVTKQGGRYWAGSGNQEYACCLGSTPEEAEKTLDEKGL